MLLPLTYTYTVFFLQYGVSVQMSRPITMRRGGWVCGKHVGLWRYQSDEETSII